MKENVNNNRQIRGGAGMVMDWMGIITRLLKNWKKIVLIGFIFGVLGILSTMLMQRKWNVTMTLAPELQKGGSSSLGSIASMLGMSAAQLGSSTDAMNITLFPEICRSTPFLVGLFDVPLTSYVSEKQAEAGVQPLHTTVYMHLSKEDKEKKGLAKWLHERRQKKHTEKPYTGVANPTELTRKEAAVVKALRESISSDVDKKTGITTISVVMDDRLMTKQLADTVCTRLQAYVSKYRTQKAQADYDYYVLLAEEARQELVRAQAAYAAAVDYDRSVILQGAKSETERLQSEALLASQIYSQMAQQRELARAKIQEDKPVYAVVQPATLPQRPMDSRSKRVLVWGFVGGFLAVAWYGFGEDFMKRFRKDVEEKIEEETA